jgi:NAD-dependent deacetylase
VFAGAGLGTESGISDYRSQGGLWQRYTPVTHQEFLESEEARIEYWRRKRDQIRSILAAAPNAAHRTIEQWRQMGIVHAIITQNIDGLQQAAGTPDDAVIELHGTNRSARCMECGLRFEAEALLKRLESGEAVPRCGECGGLIKPDTISFGQPLDPKVLESAVEWASSCDLMLAMGSTLLVEPAASLPRMAKANGSRLAIINLSETPLDGLADLIVTQPAGEFLSKIGI